jgi:hypothetical protein
MLQSVTNPLNPPYIGGLCETFGFAQAETD